MDPSCNHKGRPTLKEPLKEVFRLSFSLRQSSSCLSSTWSLISWLYRLTRNSAYTLHVQYVRWLCIHGLPCFPQGVVTNTLAVLTPMTGIKVRSSGETVKLEMIKKSRCSLLDQGQDDFIIKLCPLPVGDQRVKALSTVQTSDQGPKNRPRCFIQRGWGRYPPPQGMGLPQC